GTPLPGNRLALTCVEAAYAVEKGRLVVEGLGLGDLIDLADGTDVPFLVYRDLRERGLTVRHGDSGELEVWERGSTPPQAAAYRVWVSQEHDEIVAGDLADRQEAGIALVAVVDDDGMVTYYGLDAIAPQGRGEGASTGQVQGRTFGAQVLVDEPGSVANCAAGHLGTPFGEARLLSPLEARWLQAEGRMDSLPVAEVPEALEAVYHALRASGVVALSGFRFGTHLRGYQGDPDEGHAPWLIQAAADQDVVAWSHLSRAVRLAHGVRKAFLLAVVGSSVRFIQMDWRRP
ncbi:MAG: hypothetical protein ACPGQL_09870, partial [Thermoplasmatota archaeon]